jgi:hypothetical protein
MSNYTLEFIMSLLHFLMDLNESILTEPWLAYPASATRPTSIFFLVSACTAIQSLIKHVLLSLLSQIAFCVTKQ